MRFLRYLVHNYTFYTVLISMIFFICYIDTNLIAESNRRTFERILFWQMDSNLPHSSLIGRTLGTVKLDREFVQSSKDCDLRLKISITLLLSFIKGRGQENIIHNKDIKNIFLHVREGRGQLKSI